MAIEMIPRVRVVPDFPMLALDQELAQKAKEKLEYSPLKEALTAADTKRQMYRQLIAADILPLSEHAVAQYQKKVIRKRWYLAGILQAVLIAPIVLAISHLGTGNGWVFTASLLGLLACAYASVGVWAGIDPGNLIWHQSSLYNYRDPVPAHVLQTALLAQGALGLDHYAFKVEQLRTKEQVYPDPFLVVESRGAKVYLDVWDEPTFESKGVRL